MVPSIKKTSSLVQEISAASQEQSSGVGQINGAVTQLSHTTQQNASASEELAATAEEMSGQAEQLQQSMAFFKVADGGSTPAPRSSTAIRKIAVPAVATRRSAKKVVGTLAAAVAAPDEAQFATFPAARAHE
jgi:methyl-accepting chemotaxis protein